MIELYSGTPGSGKSFHACERIYYSLRYGKNVIANFPIKQVKRQKGLFVYMSNDDLTVRKLLEFSRDHHKKNVESQTLVVIDEAGIKFNARQWQNKDRLQWLDFFSQHRKFGFDIILISQADIMLDKQIRAFIEINHNHRKMKNNGKIGFLLSPVFTFCDVKFWYGINLRLGCDFFRYSRKIANLYDSYMLFENDLNECCD